MTAPGTVTWELRVLDTATGKSRQLPPVPLDPGASPISLKWPQGSGRILIASDSNSGAANRESRVLFVDPATGAQTSLVLSRGRDAALNALDVDASGHYLIYVLAGRSDAMTIWWRGNGKPVELTAAYNQAGSGSANEPGW